jgi:DNA polymerase-3 subunit gamma/tau
MAKRKVETDSKTTPASAAEYTVLARRYRPQQFLDVVGQEPVARALVNALESNRVAHAYLFTGARGVGKTSMARILAKALNCERGPTPTPCDNCEICRSIASGEDVDVLEIDGASNRGIDEVREIRANTQYRPARARYKVYIIDEVHMLTSPAFNALLKTLEEPPPHVKFIFATTEVQKIPITILSRCQRFDFAGIASERITQHLRQVVATEGVQADDEALEMVARRAGGSMRDAQSLLDQLLAFTGGKLGTEQLHRLLGTAHADLIRAIAAAVLEHDPAKALDLLGGAASSGLQLGELLDQLIDYWRDLMVLRCAGGQAQDLSLPLKYRSDMTRQAEALTLETILAGLDVLSSCKARLRGTNTGRVLMEMTLVRLSQLEQLVPLVQLAERLNHGPSVPKPAPALRRGQAASSSAPAGVDEKKNPNASADTTRAATGLELTDENLKATWPGIIQHVGPMLAGHLDKVESLAILGPKALVLRFPARYNREREYCQEPDRLSRIEEALRRITGQSWSVRVETVGGDQVGIEPAAADAENTQSRYRRQRAEAMQQPLLKRALDVLGAQIVHMDDGFGAAPVEAPSVPEADEEG